jgi:hypothetical protein
MATKPYVQPVVAGKPVRKSAKVAATIKKPMPVKANKGGAVRGTARAAQVGGMGRPVLANGPIGGSLPPSTVGTGPNPVPPPAPVSAPGQQRRPRPPGGIKQAY